MALQRIAPSYGRRRPETRMLFPDFGAGMKATQLHAHIRKRVQLAMHSQGINQAELCRRSGVPRATLSTQITGAKFTLDVLWTIAPILGRDIRWFLPGERETAIAAGKLPEVIRRIEDALEYGRGAEGMKKRRGG